RRRPPHSTRFPYTTLFRSRDRSPHARDPAVTLIHATRGAPPDPSGGAPSPYAGDMAIDGEYIPSTEERARVQAEAYEASGGAERSEEHTSELQSRENLVCR